MRGGNHRRDRDTQHCLVVTCPPRGGQKGRHGGSDTCTYRGSEVDQNEDRKVNRGSKGEQNEDKKAWEKQSVFSKKDGGEQGR